MPDPASPSLVEILRRRAAEAGDRVAFVFLAEEEDAWTYAELDAKARAIAAELRRHGAPGDRALLLYAPGLAFVAAFFGCLYAGVVAVPAYPPRNDRHAERLRTIADDAEAVLVLTTADLLARVEAVLPARCVATDALAPDAGAGFVPELPGPEAIAFLQYTSGSTSAPKGVMVGHGNLSHNSLAIQRAFDLGPADVGVSWLPAFHDMGLIDGILQPVFSGFPSYLMAPVSFLQQPMRWLEAISRFRGTHSGGPNFAYELCLARIPAGQRAGLDLRSWRSAYNGAEPVRAETLARFADAFAPAGFRAPSAYPCYGLAEATLMVTGGSPDAAPVTLAIDAAALERGEASLAADGRPMVSSGRAVLDTVVALVDPATLRPVAPGRVGEIWVKGPGVAQGYWRRPEQTLETFGARLGDEGPFMRTGDLGFFQGDELIVSGRLKDVIILGGRNLYPQDLELAAERAHPHVRQGCGAAFAVEQDGQEQVVVVFEASKKLDDPAAVFGAVRQALAEAHDVLPGAIVLIKEGTLPKTSSGKVQRRACRDQFLAGSLDAVASWEAGAAPAGAAGTDVRGWLIGRVAHLAGLPAGQVDPRRPFGFYGLGSLQAVQLAADLEALVGRPLSATLAWDFPTVDQLAAHLAGAVAPARAADDVQVDEPIAVVGMACRFPGGVVDPDGFWDLLASGRDAVGPVPRARWDAAALHDPDPAAIGRSVAREGGFLPDVAGFDAPFFAVSPREATAMDPQQRLALEVSWEALEQAGIAADALAGSDTGVFMGMIYNEYAGLLGGDLAALDGYVGTGNAASVASGRIAYHLGLHGPAITVDTACSSSLVAVHLACQALRARECALALAGGVTLMLTPAPFVEFSRLRALAPDGRCKPFAAGADGTGWGEGAGVVALKRLADARADGDQVLAVIRGSAVNQDGASNGLTAPSGPAQEAVIRQALRRGGIAPADVAYVEAHGTGTALGDPIEARALAAAYGEGRDPGRPLVVGSVKSNLGHTQAAAGVAGLIKAILALRHGEIPRSLHLDAPTPHVAWTRVAPAARAQAWPAGPRRAGVSSFGFGGTNAHVVLEEAAPIPDARPAAPREHHVLPLSARSPEALRALAARHAATLDGLPAAELAAYCLAAGRGRAQGDERLAVVGSTSAELAARLRAAAPASTRRKPVVAFLFTGQGSQYAGMGRDLYAREAVFRGAIDRCAATLDPLLPLPLRELLFDDANAAMLDETACTQPALFALEWALCELWRAWGVAPDMVLGHSLGEYVAACVAGVIGLEDALALVTERARLMQALPRGGAMAVVSAAAARVEAALVGDACLAALNAPERVVIAGTAADVKATCDRLEGEGVGTLPLEVSHAFHSGLMDPALDAFEAYVRRMALSPPRLPLISNLTGRPLGDEATTAAYWRRHAREPVRFADGVASAIALGAEVFLEIGPRPVLSALGATCLPAGAATWLTSLRRGRPDAAALAEAIAGLWRSGARIDWAAYAGADPARHPGLPLYPWQRRPYWLAPAAPAAPRHRAVGRRVRLVRAPGAAAWEVRSAPDADGWLYRLAWVAADRPAPTPPAGTFGVLGRPGARRQAIADALTALGAACVQADDLAALAATPCDALVDLRYLDAPAVAPLVGAALETLRGLAARPDPGRWALVTCAGQPAAGTPVEPVQAALWGLGRTLALEHPERRVALIDLPAAPAAPDLAALAAELVAGGAEPGVALRGADRFVARLARATLPAQGPALRPDGRYLLTGAFGGLGPHVARWLVARGARDLVLAGRRPPDAAALALAAELEALGCRVAIAMADVAVAADAAALVASAHTPDRPLRGVFHAAGVVADGLAVTLDAARVARVLAPKVDGAWHLHQATWALALDHFVMFSSAAAVIGSPGQAAYAAANAFMDGLAARRTADGLPALSVNWGPWAEAGMAARSAGRNFQAGIADLPVAPGLSALGRALAAPGTPLIVLGLEPGAFAAAHPRVAASPLFAGLMEAGPAARPDLSGLAPDARRAWLCGLVHAAVAAVLGAEPAAIAPDRPLSDLGLDSLTSVALAERLERELGLPLPATLVWSHPTVVALAAHLDGLLAPSAAAPAPVAAVDDVDAELLVEIRALERLMERNRP